MTHKGEQVPTMAEVAKAEREADASRTSRALAALGSEAAARSRLPFLT